MYICNRYTHKFVYLTKDCREIDGERGREEKENNNKSLTIAIYIIFFSNYSDIKSYVYLNCVTYPKLLYRNIYKLECWRNYPKNATDGCPKSMTYAYRPLILTKYLGMLRAVARLG